VASKAQATFLQERLATASGEKRVGGQELSRLVKTLHLLEREVRVIDQLLVISTRGMPEQLMQAFDAEQGASHLQGTGHAVFWRSMRWVDVRESEVSKYFIAAGES
jgi:hypothetical protein